MINLMPACDRMTEVLAGLTDDQLDEASPCSEYTVGDLVDHVDQVCLVFASFARHDAGQRPDSTGMHRSPGWPDTVARHLRELGTAWSDASAWRGSTDLSGLVLPNERWGRIALTELVVHGWDIAVATGQSFDLPEHTLRGCHEHVAEFVPNAPIPTLWGPPVTVAADAPLLDRIVAITGRTPRTATARSR
jgi:uncharacterized protein (TIGR03086 family)